MGGGAGVGAPPSGTLGDWGAGAGEALASADVIAAEDTRHTLNLLRAIGVARPLVSLHEHNESQRLPELLARLEAGETIALLSDSGTPPLSEPGLQPVQRAAPEGVQGDAHPRPAGPVAGAVAEGELKRTVTLLAKELPPARAAALAAQLTGATRAAAYALATRGASGPGDRGATEDEGMP